MRGEDDFLSEIQKGIGVASKMKKAFVVAWVLLFATTWFVQAEENQEVPLEEPNDSIMASPAEAQATLGWATTAFLEPPNTAKKNNVFVGSAIPFSFRYGGVDSEKLLKTWQRTVEFKDKDAADRVQHRVTWSDPKTGLQVTATVSAFKRYPAVEWVLHFENQGKQDTPILENIQALDAMLQTGNANQVATLHRILGDSADKQSFLPTETLLYGGVSVPLAPRDGQTSSTSISMAPWLGRPSSFVFPFFNLQYADKGLITAIGWTGQWAASLNRTVDGPTRLQAGMEKTHLVLHPGERIRSPRILLMPWKGDRLAAQQRFRRLLMFHYLPRINGQLPLMPIATEAFERYSHKKVRKDLLCEAGQLATIQFAHRIGCDSYWLDAGWFGDQCKVDWKADPKIFPNGLKPLGDACHKLGMRFILWFHPEIANIGDPAVLRTTIDTLSQRIADYGVDIFRNDFNMQPLEGWRSNDAPDRQGMTEIRYVEGLYALWDGLLQRHPGLLIDNCASGGRRLDLETCMRSVPLWRSDAGCDPGHSDWYQTQTQGLSLYLPVFDTGTHTHGSYDVRSAAAAGLVCMFDSLNKNFPIDEAKAGLAEVKENRKYWYGDYYPLTRAVSGKDQWAAYQLHRADLNAGVVYVFRREECPSPTFLVKLQKIDPAANYSVEWIDEKYEKVTKKMAGRELAAEMELKAPKRGSLIIRYRVVSQ